MFRSAGKIFQCSLIFDTGQGLVQMIVPGLQIELNATAGVYSQRHHALQQPWIHRAVGFPADAQYVILLFIPGGPGGFN